MESYEEKKNVHLLITLINKYNIERGECDIKLNGLNRVHAKIVGIGVPVRMWNKEQ